MMKNCDIAVVGAGPAGMMAAIEAGKSGKKVFLLERNDRVGKKLKITGGGRCNLTSSIAMEDFFEKIPRNSKFLYKAFKNFSNQDLIKFFEEDGVHFRTEGNKVYPISDNSEEIISVLVKKLKRSGVEILSNTMLRQFASDKEGYLLYTNREIIKAQSVILAAGGNSFPALGSDWNVHRLLEKEIRIFPPQPALVRIHSNDEWITKSMGISLEDVAFTLFHKEKKLKSLRGPTVFTHSGLSGPTVLDISSFVSGKDLSDIRLQADLLPNLSESEVAEILRRADKKNLINKFSLYLPKNLLKNIFDDIAEPTDFNNIKKAKLQEYISRLKNRQIHITGLGSGKEAIVTRGGVDVKEIDPSTMELKKMRNIFVAGEMIDVDALTGGYNLQIAFSTGILAGRSAVEK